MNPLRLGLFIVVMATAMLPASAYSSKIKTLHLLRLLKQLPFHAAPDKRIYIL